MKVYNHLYYDKHSFDVFLKGSEIEQGKPMLVRIHSSVHSAEEMSVLSKEIKSMLPDSYIIGCSARGIIYEGKIKEKTCLVSILTLDKCSVEIQYIENTKSEKELCTEISKKLVKGRNGFMFLFLPAFYAKGVKLLELLNKHIPEVKIIGGSAGFRLKKRNSYVLGNFKTSNDAAVAAFISGNQLSVYENFMCGAETSGQSSRVTESYQKNLLQIEKKSGLEWYLSIMDKDELKHEPDLAVLFPVIRKSDIKLPYLVDFKRRKENRLRLSVELPKDSDIYPGYFNPQKVLDEMQCIYHDISNVPSEALFAYDCQSRMEILHSCAKWDAEQFTSTNISGALLSGEIVNRNHKNYYTNYSFSIACLSENSENHIPLRSRDFTDCSPITHNNIKAVNYLLSASNRQLNEQLEDQQKRIHNTFLRNESLGLDNQFCYLYDRDYIHFDKVALYSLTNERMVKLFVGRKEIFDELKIIYSNVSDKFRSRKNLHIYGYESTSLLIACDKYTSMEDFETISKEVLQYLNSIILCDVQLLYRCAVGNSTKDPLHNAEAAMLYGSEHGISFVRYEKISDKLLDSEEEIHILQVIRDALSEERIVPYFQGIYDNENNQFSLYESLMRISDKEGKIYYPNQFLPVAKKYNLYEMISVVMVKRVMEIFVDKDVRISINLNVRDLYDREMIKVIFENLNKARHPENFVFELLESEAVTDYCYLKQFADKIHKKGAKIAIDDFGSGFSNLLHILRIEADYLKIDGEVIRMICDDEKSRQFVDFLSSWCSNQNIKVIAEYVENYEIQKNIKNMGISYSQGYYFSKPQPWKKEIFNL